MSLSNPTAKNPATRFIRWRGGAETIKEGNKTKHVGGKLTWYDKEEEKEKEIPLPFSFIVLDELTTITGFSESDHSGFWSNEVRNTMTDELIVRTSAGIKARGLYAKISDKIKSQGAKYATSVYIAFKDEAGELQIGNLKIAGSALTPWIEFKKKFNVAECAVFITDEPKLGKKGTNYYFMPVFDGQNMTDDTKAAAVKLDEELQQYLTTYLSRKPDIDDSEIVDDEAEDEEIEIEDIPPKDSGDPTGTTGEGDEAEVPKPAPKQDEGKINLKDVPF